MPERFEIYIVYKRRYINTLTFLFPSEAEGHEGIGIEAIFVSFSRGRFDFAPSHLPFCLCYSTICKYMTVCIFK